MSITWKRPEANSWGTIQVKASKMCPNTQGREEEMGDKKTVLLACQRSKQSLSVCPVHGKSKKNADKVYLADTICLNFQHFLSKWC